MSSQSNKDRISKAELEALRKIVATRKVSKGRHRLAGIGILLIMAALLIGILFIRVN